ncbi:MAG TPA: NUDIX hydrolase [Microlunatus sp.]|nr:NUDIX hydrolase [Microlunatus sp.]
MEHDGNGWVQCDLGHRHWGRYGAAGLLIADHRRGGEPWILLQHRAAWTASGNTWGIPGGARDSHESPAEGALREAGEETGIRSDSLRVGGELVDDHGRWSYITVLAALVESVVLIPQEESAELRWVPESQVTELDLHPGFAGTWPVLRAKLLR